ncbi:MAG: SUMF1/EgtB/PvdO family nonheme iron enzyme [Anaerolineae bacterium]|nr:SUMF1/EgtB/PvdO family nonheme iron enzyme [Anaerolineae bacterium]
MAQSLRVFVNYRRADERIFVELLRTHFMHRYGRENVFMDFDSIPYFTNFEAFIVQKVAEADVIAMIIGPRWLELMHEKAAKGEPDYVRVELEEALRLGKVIAPICIRGATMPDSAALPDALKPIAKLNAVFVSEGSDLLLKIDGIMNGFEQAVRTPGRSIPPPAPTTVPQSERLSVTAMIERFTAARSDDNLPEALIWLARIRASGQPIPAFFRLEEREAELQERLRAEEEQRRRREVADFQFEFVRQMIKLKDPFERILAAVDEIGQIDPGYLPDDLQEVVQRMRIAERLRSAPPKPALNYRRILSILVLLGMLAVVAIVIAPRLLNIFRPITLQDALALATTPVTRNADWTPFEQDFDGVPMMLVPAGCFNMGSDPDAYYWDGSQWTHGVPDGGQQCFDAPFWIDQTEVTQAQFARFGGVAERSSNFTGDQRPVERITWIEARDFCALRGVRLPSEREWEYTVRGPDGLKYPWGDEWDGAKAVWNRSDSQGTAEVGSIPAGASWVGALDMSGNLWEWVGSQYVDYPYNAADGREDINRTNIINILRGGSWSSAYAVNLRAASRGRNPSDLRNINLGFRCARSSE